MKKVSVIMPIYNMCDKLRRGVMSIVNQTYPAIEIILVDDGSSDNSYEVCTELAEKYDFVQIFHTENQGSGKARNYGIAQATGEYLYFMDADDELDADAFRIVVERMEQTGADLAVFGYRILMPDGTVRRKKTYRNMEKHGSEIRTAYELFMEMTSEYAIQGAPWNKMFKAENIRENHLCYPDMRRNQDEVFIMRYVATTQKVCMIDGVFYNYYTNNLSLVWKKYPENYVEIAGKLLEYRRSIVLGWNPQNDRVRRIADKSYMEAIIICLDLFYNPQKNYRKSEIIERMKQLRQAMMKADILWNIEDMPLFTHKVSIFFIKKRWFGMLYQYTKFKIWVKKIIGVGLY